MACATGGSHVQYTHKPELIRDKLQAVDGVMLTVRHWKADTPHAVLIALHGMNDYGHAFEGAGIWWSQNGIDVYAYDQRGFGLRTEGEISVSEAWPGVDFLIADLQAMVSAVKNIHPDLPVYVLGHSMGGAVVLSANEENPLEVDGIVLAAPAIWGGSRMPFFYRLSLSVARAFAPGKKLTGARARRQATDNIPILRGMQKDPLVIKETPIRSIDGMVDLMGRANRSIPAQRGNILYLMGCRDEIIPVDDLASVGKQLAHNAEAVDLTLLAYPEGWHLLFRDLQAARVWQDVAVWIDDQIKWEDAAAGYVWSGAAASSCSAQ